MAKSIGNFRDSRALSWLSVPRTDAPDEPPLKGPALYHTRFCKSSSLNMPAASATAKMSFSVLRRLKTCGFIKLDNTTNCTHFIKLDNKTNCTSLYKTRQYN